jgi:hypothetical protein
MEGLNINVRDVLSPSSRAGPSPAGGAPARRKRLIRGVLLREPRVRKLEADYPVLVNEQCKDAHVSKRLRADTGLTSVLPIKASCEA